MSIEVIRGFLKSQGVPVEEGSEALLEHEKDQYRAILTTFYGVTPEVVDASHAFLDVLPPSVHAAVCAAAPEAKSEEEPEAEAEEPEAEEPEAEAKSEEEAEAEEPEAKSEEPEAEAEEPEAKSEEEDA